MKALLIPVGEAPKVVEVDGLEDLQKFVGGYIESAGWIMDDDPAIYVNEEGKFNGCMPNRAVYAPKEWEGRTLYDGTFCREGQVLDIIYGDFVAIGFDPGTGSDKDITDEQIERVMARFSGSPEADLSGGSEFIRLQHGMR